jgi:hypothetical protein
MFFAWQATIVDYQGKNLPGATLTVRSEETGNLVQLFSNVDGTNPVSNPTTTDSQGFVRVYVAQGRYRVDAALGAFKRTWRHVDLGPGPQVQASRYSGPLFPITEAEASAGIREENLQLGFEPGNILRYGADPTDVLDSSPAMQRALEQWLHGGAPLYAPAGIYRMNSALVYQAPDGPIFPLGFTLHGDGVAKTIFDSRVANGALFDFSTQNTNQFMFSVQLKGFTLGSYSQQPNSSGISARSVYMLRIEEVNIRDMTQDGIKIICTAADNDACNMPSLRQVRIEDCDGWGINFESPDPNHETSFTRFEQVFVQNCGTHSAGTYPPTSGGTKWKGQILYVESCAWAINNNVGLFIEGGSSNSNAVTIIGTDWENNRGIQMLITGCQSCKGICNQVYTSTSNKNEPNTYGVYVDGSMFPVEQIDWELTTVRAKEVDSPYTAFYVTGVHATRDKIRFRNTWWKQFDYPGQVRHDGVRFDTIPQQCEFVTISSTTARLRPRQSATNSARGNVMPIRLRGPSQGGVPSQTGEWVPTVIPLSGYSVSNAGLSPNTTYFAYLYDNNGTPTIDLDTQATVVDPDTGYVVKDGVPTHLYIGKVRTDGSGNFNTLSNQQDPLFLNGYYIWIDADGRMRRHTSFPIFNSDGIVIGPGVRTADNYASDAAAGSNGIAIGELYHTDGSVKVRRS